ncbi:hypothetical protein N7470_000787 [Penicillium chermesinum]|nr:hypothetical protein N7470_000787 [Penicillium chermesinum]
MDGPGQTSASAAPAGNSSDFVRKLYKNPSYASIVRWGDEGDSFVVLECEKFTKTILPKHFKHSNFASFVRQLNKYDFHKVRQNNEESGQSPYGQNSSVQTAKIHLITFGGKAPAPRKQAQTTEESVPTQQIDLLNQQILAQQQQIQHLSDRYAQLTVDHQLMLQEVMRVQKTVVNHENVIHQVMSYLLSVDARQKRESKSSVSFPAQGGSTMSPLPPGGGDDEPSSSPLQQASKLLSDMNAEIQFNLPGMDPASDPQRAGAAPVATPTMDAASRNGSMRSATTAPPNAALVYPKMGSDLEQVVYPVGATNGIDPMYSEHVNNVPYPMPTKTEGDAAEARRQQSDNRKKSTNIDPGWVRNPRILLVEDDSTCRQIGGKFLFSFSCVIDTAFDGLEAVNKMQDGSNYDLILMDIIMPNLDGVSACHLIRQFDQTPIIAMTSNIRSDDIQLYYQHGMNGVLPKPFTRKSLLDMLEQHLAHLKSVPPGIEAPPPPVPVTMAPQTSATQSIKEDSSPGQSPAGSMAWQSPGQFQGMAPVQPSMTPVQGQYVAAPPGAPAYAVDQNGVQFPAPAVAVPSTGPPARPPHRRQLSEMSSVGENQNMAKRQRMYTQPQPMMAVQAGRPV